MSLVIVCFALFFLVLVSASEISFYSLLTLDKEEMESRGYDKNKSVMEILENLRNISTSVTLWRIVLSVLFSVFFLYVIYSFSAFSDYKGVFILASVIVLILCLLFFGEILPNFLAYLGAYRIAKNSAPTLKVLERITHPFSSFLSRSSKLSVITLYKKNEKIYGDELAKTMELVKDETPEEKEMMDGIVTLRYKTAVEIMTSRPDVSDLPVSSTFGEVVNYIIEAGYSRIPVYEGNKDNIKGVIYIKDLLPHVAERIEDYNWQGLIRPVYFIPEMKRVDDLLKEFRTNKMQMAVVVDEFGGVSGIVTMEDILEEIVGEINDEYDDDEMEYKKINDNIFEFNARILLEDFFEITGIDEDEFTDLTRNVDTLAGLVLEIKGDFPSPGEMIKYRNYSFIVMKVLNRRILKVKLFINKKEEPEDK